MEFPQPPKEDLVQVYMEDTDKPLPTTIDTHTRYAFFKTIARGGKSLIQSCRDLHLRRTICHKSIRKELKHDQVEQQRFLREARVTAMLQHPNTVPVYEVGRDGHGHLYFTMKLVHGYTLREVLNYRDRYDLVQLVDVLVQIAYALDYAHTHGVVHRDLKPENILVGPFGEVLLLDWGLAKVWGKDGLSKEPPEDTGVRLADKDLSMTSQGKLQGTVAYMSPEQIQRDPDIDCRTDIYSLGAVLYELASEHLPSPGKNSDQIIDAVLHKDPERLTKVSKYLIPEGLEAICARCLRKDPRERYATMSEMIRQLQGGWR
ncbi:MAG: serine/threonine-protein kinase [Deltaproteobacteria bacterium]